MSYKEKYSYYITSVEEMEYVAHHVLDAEWLIRANMEKLLPFYLKHMGRW